MSFSKFLDLKTVLLIILGLAAAFIYFFKESQIDSVKDEKITIVEKLVEAEDELKKCNEKVEKQNKTIEDMKVEVKYIEPKTVEKVKNIYVKDSTCESLLNAYKELFDE